MTAGTSIVPPPDAPWIDDWLSIPRLSRYLTYTGGDRQRAIALYEWNAQTCSALHRDLAYLEVALRNAYDSAATANWPGPPGHWLLNHSGLVFAPVWRTKRASNGRRVRRDMNEKPRRDVEKAVAKAGGPSATAGKVVAELSFGFWRYLSSSAHEKTLWVPLLHHAFPVGTNRADLDAKVGRLHDLRNRMAHHEPLIGVNLTDRMVDLLDVADLIRPELAVHLKATSRVPALSSAKP